MAIPFPSTAVGGERWSRRAAAAQQDYLTGVQQASGRWQPAAAAGAPNYATGVQAAVAAGSFARGVQRAGDAKWQDRATKLGPSRFAGGVVVAQPAYEAGVTPIWSRVAAMTLPPRGPKGASQNYQRPALVAQEMRKAAGK